MPEHTLFPFCHQKKKSALDDQIPQTHFGEDNQWLRACPFTQTPAAVVKPVADLALRPFPAAFMDKVGQADRAMKILFSVCERWDAIGLAAIETSVPYLDHGTDSHGFEFYIYRGYVFFFDILYAQRAFPLLHSGLALIKREKRDRSYHRKLNEQAVVEWDWLWRMGRGNSDSVCCRVCWHGSRQEAARITGSSKESFKAQKKINK